MLKRIIYVAGVNNWNRLQELSVCPYWLLSVTLIRRKNGGVSPKLLPYFNRINILFDPGTFSYDSVSYLNYRRFLEEYAQPHHQYLQYDEIGDPEATAWYLQDMRRRGFNPIPILTPGGDPSMLSLPVVAVGGVAKMSRKQRFEYLDSLFYPNGVLRKTYRVHLLGLGHEDYFRRYPATSGDSTTWIPRQEPHRRKSIAEWMKSYGEQYIPFEGIREALA